MKHLTKRLALLLAILTCLGAMATALVGCQNDAGSEETTADSTESTQTPGSSDTQPSDPDKKVKYSITIQSAGGLKMAKATLLVYADAALSQLVGYGETNAEGVATMDLPAGGTYYATVTGLPTGYNVAESYPLTGAETTLVITSSVINTTDHTGVTYKLGDVIRDFKVTDTEGNEIVLSELLKTKKMVLINFWYSECGPCVSEFPYLNSSYQKYKDDVEVVAISHYSKDTEDVIKAFREEYGLTFPMGRDYTGMAVPFNIMYYPTSIVVDRYGVICLIEEGALTSETPFNAIFNHFTAENYQQKLITNLDEIVEREKPDVEMPSSDEIKNVFASGIDATFHPETNEADAEYSWPFIITKKDGVDCIANSNVGKNSSYATMYTTVTLKKGQALAFDYYASSEQGADVLYLLAKRNDINKDTYKDIYQISGEDSKWNTCYTYVATEDGEYSIGFCFIKDTADAVGDDRVYLKNLRVEDVSKINTPTYIPRFTAWDLLPDESGYKNYATVVYNETDGLYHVGTKDGPLLLVDLMKSTRFSTTGIYYMALDGKITLDGKDYLEELIPYASYASNSAISGLTSVNQELKELLEIVALAVGIEADNPNQWLQMCSYYDAYGTGGVQLADPTKGLYTTDADNVAIIDPAKAFVAQLGENAIVYDRMIMPRGLVAKFVPDQSGVYHILSKGDILVEGWIFAENGTEYYLYEGGERLYTDANNVSMYVYMEAGKTYYIDICYYDVYQMGTVYYDISYIGATHEIFTVASPGYFTFPEDSETGDNLGDLAVILAGGINVKLGSDGKYYELREDGTLGSKPLYADFLYTTSIFGSESLESLIDKGAFDFTKTEDDEYILDFIRIHGDGTKDYLKKYWGEQYEELAAAYKLDEVLAGKIHGTGEDMTEVARAYAAKKLAATAENPELEGCVVMDEELAKLLQQLMDKYTFAGVEHSWTKLCYYYQEIGA